MPALRTVVSGLADLGGRESRGLSLRRLEHLTPA